MSSLPRLWRSALLVAIPLMLTNCERCGKKPEDPVIDVVADPPKVDISLQVVSLRPASIGEGVPLKGSLSGAGFSPGMTAKIGETPVEVVFQDENTLALSGGPFPVGEWDVTVAHPAGTQAVLRRGLAVQGVGAESGQRCADLTLLFELDKAGLGEDARRQLRAQGPCYQASRGEIAVEGHADERGTTEYNLGLGQRRADAVKQNLSDLGVSPSRIRTISYGEERPVDRTHGESGWARNRRAEVRVAK